MNDEVLNAEERDLIGQVVSGEILAIFRWGLIVDLGLSRVGLVDVLYIDGDEGYVTGGRVSGYLDVFDEQKEKFILRPVGQTSLAERLRMKGFDV
ncbi:hypothetical protein ACFC0N_05705 [Streptomyces zaomyceticus]|uniref:hypothetical protein n=1 Tax=Streptomyces zaomyceticus TaxID=68286 RepID=UPI0035DA2745